MGSDFGIAVFTGVVNISLGLFSLANDRRSASNRLMFALSLVIGSWAITNYYSLHSETAGQTLLWIRVVMLVTSFLGPVLFLLIHTVPNKKISLGKKYLIPLLALMLLTAALSVSPYMYTSVDVVDGVITPQPGVAILLFAANFIGLSVLSIMLLVKRYLKSTGVERVQLKFVLIGVLLTFSLMILIFVTIVVTRSSVAVIYGPLASLLLVSFFTYAIIEHHLFEVRVFVTRALTYVLLLVLFAKLFVVSSLAEFAVDTLILVFMAVFGYLLVKSIKQEIEHKEELEKLTKRLKEIDKTKNEFISVAAHELRAPLTAVKGYSSMILDGDTGNVSSKAKEFLQDILVSTARMIRLVNNMLDVGRIEEGRIIYQEDYYQLSEIVGQAFKEFEIEAARKSLNYELQVGEGVLGEVYVDRDRLHEVVVNFLSNALKYTDEGGVTVKVTNPEEGRVKVAVVDTGRGITKKEQGKLFSKFYRVKSNIGKTIGSGLGLYISKLLVEKFGGQIGVDSESGRGSDFWFVLPLADKGDSLDRKENDSK